MAVAARLLHGTADSPCSVSMDAQPFKQCASGGQRLANHSGVASLGSSQLYSLLSSLALARAALFSVMPSASRYTEKVEEARGEGEKERGREGERKEGGSKESDRRAGEEKSEGRCRQVVARHWMVLALLRGRCHDGLCKDWVGASLLSLTLVALGVTPSASLTHLVH